MALHWQCEFWSLALCQNALGVLKNCPKQCFHLLPAFLTASLLGAVLLWRSSEEAQRREENGGCGRAAAEARPPARPAAQCGETLTLCLLKLLICTGSAKETSQLRVRISSFVYSDFTNVRLVD